MAKMANMNIIVVGGGFIGPALVHMLQGAGYTGRISHIAPPVQQVNANAGPLDVRATALSYSSGKILATMGAWPAPANAPSPITSIHVSQQGSFGSTLLRAAPYPALGYVVENDALQAQLQPNANAHANTQSHEQNIISVSHHRDGISVTLEDGSEIDGQLLICADGAKSATATMAGFTYESALHNQVAIAGNVRLASPHNGLAIERFTREGPVALLPLISNQGDTNPDVCSLVLCHKAASSQHWQQKTKDDFLDDLSALFNGRVHAIDVGARQSFPLHSHRANHLCTSHAVVIGNAAQALHPVAGQGFNLGLRDAATLAELLIDNRYSAENYAALRDADRRKLWHATNTLPGLFMPSDGPLPWARGAGLLGLDIAEKLNHRRFKEHAMGLKGWQSKLARGIAL